MSATVTVEEAQAHLKELIGNLAPGEEVVILEGQRPVAKIVGQGIPASKPRRPGSAKGKLIILREDDEHLKDFEEYSLNPMTNESNTAGSGLHCSEEQSMTKTIHGRIHGKTIELDEDLGAAEGQEVEVQVTVIQPNKKWGEGILRTAGALADDPYWDAIMEEIYQARKVDRRPQGALE